MARATIRGTLLAVAAAGAPAASVRAAQAPDAGFRAMIERPLFSPTRRPPPPAPTPLEAPVLPAAPPPATVDVALSGVIAGGGGGVALLKRPLDPAPVRVPLGGQIDGWTLAEIHPRSVVLRREARSLTVDLPGPAR